MKVPRPLRLATDVSRLLMLCPHSGSAGRRSAATTTAPAASLPAERALLSGPCAQEDRTGAGDGVVARVGGEANLRGAPGSNPCASVPERLPGCRPPARPPADGPRDCRLQEWGERGSWVALAEEAWRARPHSARGEAAAGARLPALCKRGWSEIHASRGRWSPLGSLAHLLTRSGADKGHLGAEATAARGSTASRLAPDSCSESAAGAPQATWPCPAELSPPAGSVPEPAKPKPDAPGLHSR